MTTTNTTKPAFELEFTRVIDAPRARQSFKVMTAAAKHATAGAKQGWTMTLNQLTEFVSLQ